MADDSADILRFPFDGPLLLRKQRKLRRALAAEGGKVGKRIAVLGGSTTEKAVDLMDLFLLSEGIQAQFYQCDYARFWEEAVFDNPELLAFNPDLIIVHTTVRNLSVVGSWTPDQAVLDDMLEHDRARFKQVWDSLTSRYACPIIQNNFERPPYRMLGSSDVCDPRGISSYVLRMNEFLYDYVRENSRVYVHDIDYLSARVGLSRWHDQDSWFLYKSAFAMSLTADYAYSVTRIVKALFGKNKKAVVLDLDNTLWSGVVGDDGPEGIVMGSETALGERHRALQEYLRHFPEIGVILAVNSKNDEENALAGLQHEDCLLPPSSFAAIAANWNPKSENMKLLADVLSLGMDSFVFVDDNPAEREIVSMSAPGVTSIDFEDVGQVARLIDDGGYFEVVSLTDDDAKRAEMYRANAARTQFQASYDDYGAYLDAMEMKCEVNGFDSRYIARIAQLTNKTNQFNLTTLRCTEDDINRFSMNEAAICLSFKLKDKFGDNGLISVVLAECEGDVAHIRLWLMSCRVLKRGVEDFAFNELAQRAIEKNVSKLRGYYYPTKKNGMVKELYPSLGFTCVEADDEGNSVWEFDLGGFAARQSHIALASCDYEEA